MSFSSEVKEELIGIIPSARHCQLAELSALLNLCGTVQIDDRGLFRIVFCTEQRGVADKYVQLLKLAFHMNSEDFSFEDRVREKTDLYEINIDDSETSVRILQAIRFLDRDGNIAEDTSMNHRTILQKTCCKRAYIRGVFLAGGSISDPNKSYHFEVVCDNEPEAQELGALMQSLEIDAHVVARKKYFVVYVKESAQISDLLGIMEASVSLLQFENIRVVREVRGNVNRKVNCETANINKTANAAARQIEDIQLIEKTVGFGALSNGLDEVAQVRLQYPMATLAEIGQMLEKPVGKSGVNHRLRKLSQIAESLREEQGGSI